MANTPDNTIPAGGSETGAVFGAALLFFESIAKRMIKYLLFARSHEIWQREIL